LTLHDVVAAARRRLIAAGINADEAAIDVDLYVTTILDWDRVRLVNERHALVPPGLEPRFSEWIARRERREPSAYIVGKREFWGLEFAVSPAVLIPRPETEFIVEEALARLRGVDRPRIADVGTGSGCIAVSLAHSLPGARVTATDISPGALKVARDNAVRHAVADRVGFVQTSYLDGVSGPFDGIVSNPPYVKDADRVSSASRAVVAYEPHVALFGGEDGLGGVRSLLDAAHGRLVTGGWLVFEFGLGQDDEVSEIVRGFPQYQLADIRSDLQGIPRTAIVRRGD
jgi:release factor glutamine methyltransferase